jgi:hypothetical protein
MDILGHVGSDCDLGFQEAFSRVEKEKTPPDATFEGICPMRLALVNTISLIAHQPRHSRDDICRRRPSIVHHILSLCMDISCSPII